MVAPVPVEIELKLRLPPDEVPRIANHSALAGARRGRARREHLVATYFDTPGLDFAASRLAVRLRREGGRWVQAIKGPATPRSGAGLAERAEFEQALGRTTKRPSLRLDALLATPWRRPIARALRTAPPQPVFTTDIWRTTVPLSLADGTRALLCIDVGKIRTGGRGTRARQLPVCEIELELESGDPRRLFDLALAFAGDVRIAVETKGKAERGYALLRPPRAAPTHAAPVDLDARLTAAQALAAIVGECTQQIERNAEGALRSGAPEYVHQMRVGMRRLRSCLSLFRAHVPPESLTPLVGDLRGIALASGELRDLDVLLTETLPQLEASRATALADLLAPLAAAAVARRTVARRALRTALRSTVFPRVVLSLGRLRISPLLGAEAGAPGALELERPARAFAENVLKRRYAKLRRRGERLVDGTDDDRHAARIAAKRMRYAAEFFAPLFSGKRARRFAKALAQLQDALGRGNDAATAVSIARRLCGGDSPAAAALAGWAVGQAAGRDRDVLAAWKGFLDCPPFWKQG